MKKSIPIVLMCLAVFLLLNRYASKKMPLAYAAEMSEEELYDSSINARQKWAYAYDNNNSAEEQQTIRKWLTDSMGIRPSDDSYTKLDKIFAWLAPSVPGTYDVPADSVYTLPVSKLAAGMRAKSIKLFCTNHTEMLGKFATEAGLQVRSVTNEGAVAPADSLHSFNEIYIPESRAWAYADLTHGIAWIKENNEPVGILQLNRLLENASADSAVLMKTFQHGVTMQTLKQLPPPAVTYFKGKRVFRFYFSSYLQHQRPAGFFNRARLFLSTEPQFAFNGVNSFPGAALLIRLIASYGLLLSSMTLVFFLAKKIYRGIKNESFNT